MGIISRLLKKEIDNDIEYAKLRPTRKVRSKGSVAVELEPM